MKIESFLNVFARWGVILLGVAAISGCSSGGGDGEGPSPGTFSATSAGVASKGIIRDGVVTAQELDGSGAVVATVGTAQTDADGRYSLTIGSNYGGGPILLTISGRSDGTTRMKCDVSAGCGGGVAFGQWMALDASFRMSAILPPVSQGEQVSAQITPFTHMAARRALAAPTVDGDAVERAISEVNQIVGINILQVEPVDITDTASLGQASAAQTAYAAFVAGAGAVAFSGGDLQEGLDALAEAFEDGELSDTDPVDPVELLGAVEGEADANGLAADPLLAQVLMTMRTGIEGDCEVGGCSLDPEPADAATMSAIEKARDIVAQTRRWANSLDELENPADLFSEKVDNAGALLEGHADLLARSLGHVMDAAGRALEARAALGELALETFVADVADGGGAVIGTVRITLSDRQGLVIGLVADDLETGVVVDIEAITDLPAGDALALFGQGTPMVLASLGLELVGQVHDEALEMRLESVEFTSTFSDPVTVDLVVGTAKPVLTELALRGDIVWQGAGLSYASQAAIEFVPLDDGPGGLDSVSMAGLGFKRILSSGTFSDDEGTSYESTFSLTVANAGQIDTLGALACGRDEYVNLFYDGDPLGAAAYAADLGIVSLESASYDDFMDRTSFVGLDDGGNIVGRTIPEDVLGVADYLASLAADYSDCALPPERVDYISYYHYASDTPYTMASGTLVFPSIESPENFANVVLAYSVKMALAGYPDVTTIFSISRDSYRGASLSITLSYRGQSLTFFFGVDEEQGFTGNLTITTPDGVELVLDLSSGTGGGVITVDGTEVATLERSGGMWLVRYSDGTFESVN